ncbi:MAG: helix-turn-helix domain-containing protein [Opitutales bacterium]|nr:helix-turn-helix domain-containing protein [Opitutales bacterium]
MEEKLFNDLLESVKQMKAIRSGKMKPAKVAKFEKNEITDVRRKLNMTQTQFATAFGISVSTLRNWEQGHRNPTGAAVTLIKVARKHPKAVLEAVLA